MSTSRTASCACGQLRVNVVGEPVRVGICNCTQCQRRTGAAFAVGAFFPNSQISGIEGAHKAFTRSSDAGRKVEYHFCADCGSTVFWHRQATPELTAISVGCFTDPTFPAPVAAIWAAHKLQWVVFPPGMPVLDAQPG
ncbi:MAG: GFA family protein [Xanthobacteraceae bacterium]|jgi:hypothetical protein